MPLASSLKAKQMVEAAKDKAVLVAKEKEAAGIASPRTAASSPKMTSSSSMPPSPNLGARTALTSRSSLPTFTTAASKAAALSKAAAKKRAAATTSVLKQPPARSNSVGSRGDRGGNLGGSLSRRPSSSNVAAVHRLPRTFSKEVVENDASSTVGGTHAGSKEPCPQVNLARTESGGSDVRRSPTSVNSTRSSASTVGLPLGALDSQREKKVERRQSPAPNRSPSASTRTPGGVFTPRERGAFTPRDPKENEVGAVARVRDRGALSPRDLKENDGSAAARVRVVVRIRPRLKREDKRETEGIEISADAQSIALTNGRETKCYTVDQVVDSRIREGGSQQAFFGVVGPSLVSHSVKGYNVCIFAYGHTGSGKTYTMLGDGIHANANAQSQHSGLLPRFLHELFQARAEEPRTRGWRCSCEFYEVYNETIRDLLSPAAKGDQRTRRVHVHPKYGVRVDGLSTCVFTSEEEALQLLSAGSQIRSIAGTTMNERSSRSHAFFTFTFKYESVADDALSPPDDASRSTDLPFNFDCQSTVTFVDLAGREDRAASQNQAVHFREMCHINTSLFHLAHLIKKLSSGDLKDTSLSDFRNSKLTLLLSQALTGNSRTALVATLAPLTCFFEDSCSTMGFATSVKKIQTKPVVNNKSTKAVIAELEAEVRRLQRELENQKTFSPELQEDLNSSQAMISYYKRTWEDAIQGSDELKQLLKKTVVKLGLGDQGVLLANGRMQPFLTKLCDDPLLQGACNYFLSKEELRIGSNDQVCDVVLHGLGIASEMCVVVRDEDTDIVEVSLLETNDDSVHVIVAGQELTKEKPSLAMNHADSLILGYSHAFRLVVPTAAQLEDSPSLDAMELARSSLGHSKLDIGSAMMEHGMLDFDQELVPYVRHLSACLPAEAINRILRDANCLGRLLDEANLITREVLGNDDMVFQLQTLSNITKFGEDNSELVISLLSRSGLDDDDDDLGFLLNDEKGESNKRTLSTMYPKAHTLGLTNHMLVGTGNAGTVLLGVVTVEDFLLRLDAIRDVYQEACDANDGGAGMRIFLAEHPYSNPWHISSFTDVKVLAELAATTKSSTVVSWLNDQESLLSDEKQEKAAFGKGFRSVPVSAMLRRRSQSEAGKAPHFDSQTSRSRPNQTSHKLNETPRSLGLEEGPDRNTHTKARRMSKRFGTFSLGDFDQAHLAEGTKSTAVAAASWAFRKRSSAQALEDSLSPPRPFRRTNSMRSEELLSPVTGPSPKPSPAPADAVAMAKSALEASLGEHTPSLEAHWHRMINDPNNADLHLLPCDAEGRALTDEQPLLAHSVAMSRLPFFSKVLAATRADIGSMREIRVPGVGALALERIRDFAYTNDVGSAVVGLRPEDLGRLVVAARLCNIPELQRACAMFGNKADVPKLRLSQLEPRPARTETADLRPDSNGSSETQSVSASPSMQVRSLDVQVSSSHVDDTQPRNSQQHILTSDVSERDTLIRQLEMENAELKEVIRNLTMKSQPMGELDRKEPAPAPMEADEDVCLVSSVGEDIVWRPLHPSHDLLADGSMSDGAPTGTTDTHEASHKPSSRVASLGLYFDDLDYHRVNKKSFREDVIEALCQKVGARLEWFAGVEVRLQSGGTVADIFSGEGTAAQELLRRLILSNRSEGSVGFLDVRGQSARIMNGGYWSSELGDSASDGESANADIDGDQMRLEQLRRDLVMHLKDELHAELSQDHETDCIGKPTIGSSLGMTLAPPASPLNPARHVNTSTIASLASSSHRTTARYSDLSLVASAVAELVRQLRCDLSRSSKDSTVAPAPTEAIGRSKGARQPLRQEPTASSMERPPSSPPILREVRLTTQDPCSRHISLDSDPPGCIVTAWPSNGVGIVSYGSAMSPTRSRSAVSTTSASQDAGLLVRSSSACAFPGAGVTRPPASIRHPVLVSTKALVPTNAHTDSNLQGRLKASPMAIVVAQAATLSGSMKMSVGGSPTYERHGVRARSFTPESRGLIAANLGY